MDGPQEKTPQTKPIEPKLLGITAQELQNNHGIDLNDQQKKAVDHLAGIIATKDEKIKKRLTTIAVGMDRNLSRLGQDYSYEEVEKSAKGIFLNGYRLTFPEADKALEYLKLLFPKDQQSE